MTPEGRLAREVFVGEQQADVVARPSEDGRAAGEGGEGAGGWAREQLDGGVGSVVLLQQAGRQGGVDSRLCAVGEGDIAQDST